MAVCNCSLIQRDVKKNGCILPFNVAWSVPEWKTPNISLRPLKHNKSSENLILTVTFFSLQLLPFLQVLPQGTIPVLLDGCTQVCYLFEACMTQFYILQCNLDPLLVLNATAAAQTSSGLPGSKWRRYQMQWPSSKACFFFNFCPLLSRSEGMAIGLASSFHGRLSFGWKFNTLNLKTCWYRQKRDPWQ